MLTTTLTAILAVGIVLVVASMMARDALEVVTHSKLQAFQAARCNALLQFLEESKAKLHQLAVAPATAQSLVEFTEAYRQLGTNASIRLQRRYVVENRRDRWDRDLYEVTGDPDVYDAVHARQHGRYRDRHRLYAWDDVVLVDPSGNVVYSILKEQDFATNLLTGPWKDSGLARAVSPLLHAPIAGVLSFADFSRYQPSNKLPASFIAMPVFDNERHRLLGVVAMQLSTGPLNAVMHDKAGQGKTGETFLVGRDGWMLTDSRFEERPTALRKQLHTEAVRAVLGAREGIIDAPDYRGVPSLIAFKPLHPFQGAMGDQVLWGVIAKIDRAEALRGLTELQGALLGVGGLIALCAGLAGVWGARSVLRPILAIQAALTKLARGEEASVPGLKRRDEIGDMAQAAEGFRLMARQIEHGQWLNESLAGLTTAVSSQSRMSRVPDAVLGYLCELLKVPVAALYFADGHGAMVRAGIHGVARRSQAEDRFEPGTGLVGQVARDRRPVVLSPVPEGAGVISGGLGEFAPRELVLYPIVHKNEVLAVLELASLAVLTPRQHEFLAAAGTGLGLHLANLAAAEHNLKLLTETRRQAEILETQRKRLDQASLYARSLIEAALDPLVTISAEGRIMDVNNATESVTGVAREQLIGSSFSTYFTEPDKAWEGCRQIFALGSVKDYPLAIRHVSGRVTDVLYNANVYYDANGEVAGAFAAARDVTEAKRQQEILCQHNEAMQALTEELKAQNEEFRANQEELRAQQEELQQKNRLLEAQGIQLENSRLEAEARAGELQRADGYKSQFLANMSHELRTPLNSILILAKNLADNEAGNLDAGQIEAAAVIRDSGSHLLDLINDILDLSKIEAGRMELHEEDVPVADLVAYLRRIFSPMTDKKGIAFAVDVEPFVPRHIRCDRQRLTQILTNLLSNAVKFTEAGQVRLSARREGDDLCFSVSDTGIGIPQDKHEAIFGVFQQGDGSTSRKYGGSGLGLAISKRLIELMGGCIRMTSAPGLGSTFSIRWPLLAPPNRSGPAEPVGAMIPAGSDRQPALRPAVAILVVEDDKPLLGILERLIDTLGFGVIAVDSGEKALAQIATARPAGVLLDLGLPGMHGIEVLRRLKAEPELARIPVYIMSGVEDTGEAKALGALGYLRKPVSRDAVAAAIRAMVEQGGAFQRLLAIEDNALDVRELRALFRDDPIDLVAVSSGREALDWLKTQRADVIVLDLMLPDMSGFDWLELMAECAAHPPIVVHSAREVTEEELFRLRRHAEVVVTKATSNERLREEVLLALRGRPVEVAAVPAARGQRLLLVDDDVRNLFALAKVLRGKGYTVEVAPSAAKALELLEQQSFAAVLSDIMMPEMDGYALIERIRARGHRDLPIVAVTAKAMPGDVDRCLRSGANTYVTKPVDVDALLDILAQWL